MRPSASRAQTSTPQRSNAQARHMGPEQRGEPKSDRTTARGLHAGEGASSTPTGCPLTLPYEGCCLDPSASCTTAPLPSDDDLPCCPDPAAAPSARAGSVLIAIWTRVFVTVVHTTLPLVCLVVLFGERWSAGMLASSLILFSAGPPGGPHCLKNLPT